MAKNTSKKKSGSNEKNKKVNIQPLRDRVLVEPLEEKEAETVTASGIILPGKAGEEKPYQGTVLAVGEGKIVDGQLQKMSVSVGDNVVFSKYGYDEVKMGEDTYYLIKEDDILAVIK